MFSHCVEYGYFFVEHPCLHGGFIVNLILTRIGTLHVLCNHNIPSRLKSAKITDKRVHVMNEIITGIRVIKMYAWEYAFKRVVTTVRK